MDMLSGKPPVIKIPSEPKTNTLSPTCTGTSTLGIKFKDGVVIAADMLVSYGSLARYMDFQRLHKVNANTVIACSGDMADYQVLKRYIEEQTRLDDLLSDGFRLSPHALHSWITRVMYNRRSRFNPLWNTYLVGGIEADGRPFLGYCNMLGVSFSEDSVATGFGSFLALPLLRQRLDDKAKGDANNLSEEDAVEAITDAMRQLYYRDCRAFDTYQLAIVRKDDATISEPLRLQSDWSVAEYVHGYD